MPPPELKPPSSHLPTHPVTRPAHYTGRFGPETIDILRDELTEVEFLAYCRGTMRVYQMRAGLKTTLLPTWQGLWEDFCTLLSLTLPGEKARLEAHERTKARAQDKAKAAWYESWTFGCDPRQRT